MSQNPLCRRTYLVCARPELMMHLQAIGEPELAQIWAAQTTVMTEPLLYEGKLEGYRSAILEKCKEAYLTSLFELEDWESMAEAEPLLGKYPSLVAMFDQWWTAEEVDTLEIETTW